MKSQKESAAKEELQEEDLENIDKILDQQQEDLLEVLLLPVNLPTGEKSPKELTAEESDVPDVAAVIHARLRLLILSLSTLLSVGIFHQVPSSTVHLDLAPMDKSHNRGARLHFDRENQANFGLLHLRGGLFSSDESLECENVREKSHSDCTSSVNDVLIGRNRCVEELKVHDEQRRKMREEDKRKGEAGCNYVDENEFCVRREDGRVYKYRSMSGGDERGRDDSGS
eukprot:763837-Hanusia_phi.AAC.2